MNELRSHPHLTLAQHLEQIRAAAGAIWARHSPDLSIWLRRGPAMV